MEPHQTTVAPANSAYGCPAQDHRTIINGILWILRPGKSWRDLPGRYEVWLTVSGRFYHGRKLSLWQHVLATLQSPAHAAGQLNWNIHCVDGSVICAHQHAAGAKRGL